MTGSIDGMIRYFGLQVWWLTEFNDAERKRLIESYGERLVKGNVTASSQTIDGFLKTLASFWKPTRNDSILASRILAKANQIKKSW